VYISNLRNKVFGLGLLLMRGFSLVVALGLALCPTIALAQSGAGSIQGTVTDSTGAVIPGASIHVVQQGTDAISDTKTNNVGFYQVPDLFTGTYTVTVSTPNMKTYVQTIDLQVEQSAVINPVMTPGEMTQRIEVAGDIAELTTTDNGTVTSTLENQRISQIPMNTREIVTLAQMTTPGLESGDGPGTRANGLMQEALEYVADGAPLDNRNFGGSNASTLAQYVDADAIQELRIQVTDANAQFALPATAIITTKSGTNSLHGSAFETAVNSYFGVAKNRNQSSTYHELPYVRNEFGVSGGGPILIPHLYDGRNRSFWFLAYERYSLASTTQELVSVPTPAMEAGDFSGDINNGSMVTLYDPSTSAPNAACPLPSGGTAYNQYCRTPFPNNQIPAGLLAPATKLLYSITPKPSNDNDPFITGNLDAPNVSYTVVPTFTFRLDHNFTENNKAYLRFTSNHDYNRALRNYPSASPATVAAGPFPAAASGYQIIPITNFAAAVGYTHIFSSTFVSETIASQQWFRQYVGGGGNPNLDYDNLLGLPNNFGETGFPVISGMHTFQFGGTMYQYQENQIISNLDENLTKTIEKHQMQFGGRFRHERLYYLNSRSADSETFADGEGTGLYNPGSGTGANGTAYAYTGSADADFFLGNAGSYSTNLEPPPSWFRDMEFDAYFQDNWHVSRNLTLNLGLRYEAHPGRETRDGVTDSFDLANHALVLGAPIATLIQQGWTTQAIINNMQAIGVNFETASQAHMPASLQENANLIFEPRFGFAWQPFGAQVGTVLRGGYGRYTFPVPTRSSNPGPTNVPFAYGYTQNYNAANQSPDGAPNYLLRDPQSIFMGQNSAGVVNTSFTGVGGVGAILPGFGFTADSPDYKPAAATQLSTTVEQPFKGNSALRVSWIWTHGSYLDKYWMPNSPPSTFIWELETGTDPPAGGRSVIGTSAQNTYAATALGPYDNTVYGNFTYDQKNGWSNDNELEINYQRLFHHGFAYQIFYVWSRAFRVGDNGFRDSQGYAYQDYFGTANNPNVTISSPYPYTTPAIPPKPPTGLASYSDYHALDVFEDYKLDSAIPPQHIQFNYIYDLPFGRGKRFLGNSNRFLDELVGGYQIAGDGAVLNQIFQPSYSNWGPTSPIHLYKHKQRITDCRSGVCYPEYLWFNGYIAPTSNANDGCTSKCVSGLPSNYTPYEEPIDTVPGTSNYNTNNVTLTGANLKAGGETQAFGSGPNSYGVNPYAKTFIHGPWNWDSDMSLYKVFPVTERVNVRFNLDVFNVFNHQGFNNPSGTDGTETYVAGGSAGASSYNTPRQIQLTLRLNF
jgi:hypothetical protein